jgi:hypothetical protein
MATWVEDNASRSATIYRLGKKATSTMSRSYKVFGYTDDVSLHADCNSRISGTLMFWQYPGADVQLRAESYSVSYLGDDAWHVEIQYEKLGADATEPDPLKRSRSFDTTGGTQHMTQALGETKYAASGSTAPDQFKAIAVDGDSVQGIDIVVPQLSWTETYDVPSTYVTSTYIKKVAKLTGTTNDAAFRTFATGEVLFLGATGSHEWDDQKHDGPWSLSFRFVASPNAGSGQTIAALEIGSITGIEKKGHEYLWVRYEDDVTDNTLLKKPKFVYVNKVYREGNFSDLGIGTS